MGCAVIPRRRGMMASELHKIVAPGERTYFDDHPGTDYFVPELEGGFLCGRGVSPGMAPVCDRCGYLAEYECDAPIGDGKRCDLPLCSECRREVGGLDLCPFHVRSLFRVAGEP